MRCWARAFSSSTSQNRWPAAVVGTSVAAIASADSRGNMSSASSEPAANWTAPLRRTASSVVAGTPGTSSVSGATTGSALGATRSGWSMVSKPWMTKIDASMGRAAVLSTVMDGTCPGRPGL